MAGNFPKHLPEVPSMPMARLGPDRSSVSRIGLGLAALGRPAYITSGRAHDLPDRGVGALSPPRVAEPPETYWSQRASRPWR